MAVVQISKIQIRRGKKNSTTGVPQLSSGELAWAVDSQQLYIGSGSVLDGAPAVGNVEVLTEQTNILSLLGSYKYASGDTGFPWSVGRSFQSKLDDTVSVKDFGAYGDGIHDDTAAFQLALEKLFLNTNTVYYKKLLVPTGRYLIAGNLYIPTNAILVGECPRGLSPISENSHGSVIVLGTSSTPRTVRFQNKNKDRVGDVTWQSGTMPVNVLISDLTFDTTYGTVDITGLNNSTFDNVTFQGGFTALGDSITTPAVLFNNAALGTRTNYINFTACKFNHVDIGVKMTQAQDLETIVKFANCEFTFSGGGVWTEGVANQKNFWSFNECQFDQIAREAIWFNSGTGTKVNQCSFIRCGNGINGDAIPYTSVVRFDQNGDNIVSDCSFSRTQALMDVLTASTACVPEVKNARASLSNRLKSTIYNPLGFLTVFSTDLKQIEIEYTLVLTAGTRIGTLSIDVDKTNSVTVINDDYSYTGMNTATMEGFTFNTTFGDYATPSDTIKETLMLSYTSGDTGTINFVVRYSV
jgi:hypothetical protein